MTKLNSISILRNLAAQLESGKIKHQRTIEFFDSFDETRKSFLLVEYTRHPPKKIK